MINIFPSNRCRDEFSRAENAVTAIEFPSAGNSKVQRPAESANRGDSVVTMINRDPIVVENSTSEICIPLSSSSGEKIAWN